VSPPRGSGGPKRSGGGKGSGGPKGSSAKGTGPKGTGGDRGSAGPRAGGAPRGGRPGSPGRPVRGGSGQRGTTPVRGREGRPSGLGGDQVEGRQAVRELLLAGRRRVREVILASGMDAAPILEDIVDLADEQKVTIREVSRGRFESLARTDAPQGVVAFAAPLPELDIHDVLESPDGRPPFLLLLDGLTDPGNVGAILRSAECAGVTGVVFPRHRAARVTPTVAKAAAGAIEHLRLATVPGLPTALRVLHERGIWSVGLDMAGSTSLYDVELADRGIALVLGSEGSGLSRLVSERCDVLAHIPMAGTLGSMNAASAAAVALFEVARRR
jgi:23S rRNA (guanosine2251-2'-O)-methyltransferase